MKINILIIIFLLAIFSSFINGQDQLARDAAEHNGRQIIDIYNKLGSQASTDIDLQRRLAVLEARPTTSTPLDTTAIRAMIVAAIEKMIPTASTAVDTAWVIQYVWKQITDRAVLDRTYAGNAGIKRRDGQALIHQQLVDTDKKAQDEREEMQGSINVLEALEAQNFLTEEAENKLREKLKERLLQKMNE